MSSIERRLRLLLLLLLCPPALWAAQTFQAPEDFVREAFHGEPPAARTVWLIGELGERAEAILGHPPRRLRERYWLKDGRSVWVLEEIGKEYPITTGWIVDHGKLAGSRVLVYRESRGWEVRYPFFTGQFEGAALDGETRLDRHIDGISGATLSVRAMRHMARLALLLHERVIDGDAP